MAGELTPPRKRQIRTRVDERLSKVNERLESISSGRTQPKIEQLRLNESKKYRLGMVFIDINSFSDYLFENSEKEALHMLSIFIPEVLEITRDYGGIFEKNTGDGVLAYFGAGKEDSDATKTILDFLATVDWALANVINPRLEENNITPISISVGAAYGSTYLSRIGVKSGNQKMNRLTAVSKIANIASRLESQAGKTEHLVGPRIKYYSEGTKWQSYFNYKDVLEYNWTPRSDSTERPFLVYNFVGEWDSTKTMNLDP